MNLLLHMNVCDLYINLEQGKWNHLIQGKHFILLSSLSSGGCDSCNSTALAIVLRDSSSDADLREGDFVTPHDAQHTMFMTSMDFKGGKNNSIPVAVWK